MIGYVTLNAALSLLAASPGATPSELVQVGGTITQARTEAPFPLTKVVQVRAIEAASSRVADSSAADASGHYALLVEPGKYTIIISMDGSELTSETLVLTAGSLSKDFVIQARRSPRSSSERMLARAKGSKERLVAHASNEAK